MQDFIRIAIIGVVMTVLAATLKKSGAELSVLLTVAVCIIIGLVAMRLIEPVLDFLVTLRSLSGMNTELMTPLLKTVGIALITQICSSVCADAGENAIAKLIELCGGILAIYVALPLLEAVIAMIRTMSGG
ncbi:MAG: stage III sporulation AC/AD family protein [Oscillospiraceae bacterium]|jgi:stage III sporulation protein AD|nr:stage III sporulation AC/AD family protein [Oscillospiraceae bacterium]